MTFGKRNVERQPCEFSMNEAQIDRASRSQSGLSIGSNDIRNSGRIKRQATQKTRPHYILERTCPMPRLLLIKHQNPVQFFKILRGFEPFEMGQRTLPHRFILRCTVNLSPENLRRPQIATLRGHGSRQRLHPDFRSWAFAARPEDSRRGAIIVEVPIVDKPQVLPKAPILGICHYTSAEQLERLGRLTGAARRLFREKDRSESVGDD